MRHMFRALIVGVGLAVVLVAPRAFGQEAKEPDTVVLKAVPLGGVKFEHKLHARDRKIKCETCHHASKPQKALKSTNQKCTDCHTKVAAAPMKTPTRGAFHDAMAKAGVCVDCHKTEYAKAKKALPKCADCHKKENV